MINPLSSGPTAASPVSRGPAPPPAPSQPTDGTAPARPAPSELTGRKAAEVVFGSRREDDRVAWRVETGGNDAGWPQVAPQGHVILADDQGVVRLDPDGRVAWRHPREAWTHARPVVTADGGCLWSPGGGGLVALDAEGQQKWRWGQGLQMQTIQPALAQDGTAYVCVQHDGWKLAAVAPDGKARWEAPLDMHASSPPVVHPDGRISVRVDLYDETRVVTFDPQGQKLWEAPLPVSSQVQGRLASGPDGSTWLGNEAGELFRITPDGKASQVFRGFGEIRAEPRVEADGKVYVTTLKGRAYGLNPDGTEAWKADLGGILDSRVERMADGTLLVGDFNKKLHALTPDGKPKWEMPLDFAADDALAVAPDGSVYLAGGKQALCLREGGVAADLKTQPKEADPGKDIAREGEDWIVVGGVKLPVRKG